MRFMAALIALSYLLLSAGCFVRPGWSSKEASVLYVHRALSEYRERHSRYPDVATNVELVQVLKAEGLLRSGKTNEKYIKDGAAVDYWGHPLVYAPDGVVNERGVTYYLYSVGPNGVDEGGTGDDYLP